MRDERMIIKKLPRRCRCRQAGDRMELPPLNL
jgi:hypothetical protein